MKQPSPEEEEQIKILMGGIMEVLYGEDDKAPRHLALKTLISCLISATHELQVAEDHVTKKILMSKENADPVAIAGIVEEARLEGWKNKASQLILLFIGHLGDMDTRQDQMDILRKCLDFLQGLSKPKIIEP